MGVLLSRKAMLYFLFCCPELVPPLEAAEPVRDWTISIMDASLNGSENDMITNSEKADSDKIIARVKTQFLGG